MSREEIEERVRRVLAEVLDLDPSAISAETSTDTVEAWSSLQHLTVVMSVEEEFEIQLDEQETVEVKSFPLIVAAVSEHLGIAEAH